MVCAVWNESACEKVIKISSSKLHEAGKIDEILDNKYSGLVYRA